MPGHYFDGAVIVAVTVVGMVQMAVDEIIHMVAVRYRFVSAPGAMLMTRLVATAMIIGRTAIRVLRTDFQNMFLNER